MKKCRSVLVIIFLFLLYLMWMGSASIVFSQSRNVQKKDLEKKDLVLSYNRLPPTPMMVLDNSDLLRGSTNANQFVSGRELFVNGNILPVYCSEQQVSTAELQIRLDLGKEYQLGKNLGTTATVSVRLVGYSGTPWSTGAIVMSTQCTLQVSSDAPEQLFSLDVKNSYASIGCVVVFVTAYSTTTVASINNALRLSLSCPATMRVAARASTDPLYPGSGTALLTTIAPAPTTITDNPVTFGWNGVWCWPNFPLYQVQILRLYNTDPTNTSDEMTVAADVDWEKALTIETSRPSLTLTLAEGRGYYVWRVRPIGNWYAGGLTNPLNWGEWTQTPALGMDGKLHLTTPNISPYCVFFYQQFDDDKNWIFTRNFSEDTQISERMNYANTLLQGEQTQQRLQSQDMKLVQQTVYDYAGRAALTTLGVPVSQSGASASNALQYVPHQSMLSYSGSAYGAEHFDKESVGSSGTVYQPVAVDGGALVNYYSASGTSNIPNAEGYPYSRTLYFSDGTNRVREQGGAGAAHRIGAGHTSRTMYVAAVDQELVRLFGDEAPAASSVRKMIQYDPNTTGTVQYISKEGKLIATALVAGTADEPLQNLNEEEIFASNSGTIQDYILDYTQGLKKNIKAPGGWRAGKTVTLTEPGTIQLDYSLNTKAFYDQCLQLCATCDYWIYFSIYSTDDNSLKFLDSVKVDPGAASFGVSSCGSTPSVAKHVSPFLQPGTYRIERRIMSNNIINPDHLSYEEWLKKKSDDNIRTRFNNLSGTDQGLDYLMRTYLSDTATAPLSDFYKYLNTHFGGYRLSLDGCDYIDVPYMACPATKCDQGNYDFEAYLKDQLGTPEKLGDFFNIDALKTPYPGIQNWGWGDFNTVIQNMLADGYDCNELWRCWEAAIEMKKSMSDPSVSGAFGNNDNGKNFNILDAFLDCTGRKFAGVSTDAGQFLKKPYMYFTPGSTGDNAYSNCLGYASSHSSGLSTEDYWQTVYKCWESKDANSLITKDSSASVVMLKDSCNHMCEYRRSGFRSAVIRAFLDLNPGLDSTHIPMLDCIVDSLVARCHSGCNVMGQGIPESLYLQIMHYATYPYDFDVPNSTTTTTSTCKAGYELVGKPPITPAMLQAKIAIINQVLLAYQDSIIIHGPTTQLIAVLDSILHVLLYDLLKESSNCPVIQAQLYLVYSWILENQIITLWQQGKLLSDRVQLYLDGCRLLIRVGTYVKSSCIYQVSHDTLIFSPPDTALSYLPPCAQQVPSYSESIVLCEDMCPPSTGCSICVHWIDPQEIVNSTTLSKHAFTVKTCKDDFAPQIKAAIQGKLQAIIERFQQEVSTKYEQTCTMPENLEEIFSVKYKMRYYHYTLYYYDRAGNLVRTVPPAGVKYANSRADHPAHQYVSQYKYNSLGQVIWQQTPDGGVTNFYCNNKGLLRLSQNAKQLSGNKYSYTKYDELTRIIEVGEATVSGSIPTNLDDVGQSSYPVAGGSITLQDRNLTYYSVTAAGVSYLDNSLQQYLQNRISYTMSDADGDLSTTTDQVKAAYSYDPHGDIVWFMQKVPGADPKYVKYTYDLVSGKVREVAYNENKEDRFFYSYEYDGDNRMTIAATSRDGKIWERDARYSYFKHGAMSRIELGEDRVQGLDYTYTIHGWLKAINHPSLNSSNDPSQDGSTITTVPKDAFGMMLGYYQGDFNKSSSPFYSGAAGHLWDNTRPFGGSLYNGNIASWMTNICSNAGNSQYGQYQTGEVFRYDRLNRILRSNFSYENSGWQATTMYGSTYGYDPNGNITALTRIGDNGQMDDLTYKYYGQGTGTPTNRLQQLKDNILANTYTMDLDDQAQTNNYVYDATGNMTQDASEGITIDWTVYKKIKQVTNTNGKVIKFLYDASGHRVRKEVSNSPVASENASTYYMLDAQGNSIAVYSWSGQTSDPVKVDYSLNSHEHMGIRNEAFNSSSDNVLRNLAAVEVKQGSGQINTRQVDKKSYELKDHLGGVRAVIGDVKLLQTGGIFIADVKSYSNYYPYGMVQPNRSWSAGSYRYGYNGKEKDDEVKGSGNSYDYGARIYDPRVGRWLSPDPEAEKSPGITPYRMGFDNPILHSDADGKYETDGHYWTVRLVATLLKLHDAKDIAFYAELPDHYMYADGTQSMPTNTWIDPLYCQPEIHCLNGKPAREARAHARYELSQARTTKDRGIRAHTLGDSYAHTNPETDEQYSPPFGHASTSEGGHWPDKIKNRPELYLDYVKDLTNTLQDAGYGFGYGHKQTIDMFAFNYIAKTKLGTEQNSDILRTEVLIQEGQTSFTLMDGNNFQVVSDYLSERYKQYKGNFGYKVERKTTTETTMTFAPSPFGVQGIPVDVQVVTTTVTIIPAAPAKPK